MISSGATFYSREAPRGSIHSLKEGREDRNENIPSIQDLLEKYQRYRVCVLFNRVHRFRLLSMTNIYLLSLMTAFLHHCTYHWDNNRLIIIVNEFVKA